METILFLLKQKMIENIYHIYVKNQCIYYNLTEEEFHMTWDMIQKFLSVHSSNIDKNDVEYEKVSLDKNTISLQGSY